MSDQARDLVAKLIGPAGPEIGCDECFAKIDQYVDLVAGGSDADAAVPGMSEHLTGCPVCRDDYESLLALVKQD